MAWRMGTLEVILETRTHTVFHTDVRFLSFFLTKSFLSTLLDFLLHHTGPNHTRCQKNSSAALHGLANVRVIS
jgi:hypothetical protein